VRIVVGIFSYDGHLYFGITGDYDTVPDIDMLRRGIEDAMAELVAAARAARVRGNGAAGAAQNPTGGGGGGGGSWPRPRGRVGGGGTGPREPHRSRRAGPVGGADAHRRNDGRAER